jgi:hypothetical protein
LGSENRINAKYHDVSKVTREDALFFVADGKVLNSIQSRQSLGSPAAASAEDRQRTANGVTSRQVRHVSGHPLHVVVRFRRKNYNPQELWHGPSASIAVESLP